MASPTRPAWYNFAPAFQIAPLSARRAWRTRGLLEATGPCNGGAEEREMPRVKMSNVCLKVSEWEVESVVRVRVNRASYADTRMSPASVAAIASLYQRGVSDTHIELTRNRKRTFNNPSYIPKAHSNKSFSRAATRPSAEGRTFPVARRRRSAPR